MAFYPGEELYQSGFTRLLGRSKELDAEEEADKRKPAEIFQR
jgi:hypothetical protein